MHGAGSVTVFVVLLVTGILALQALIWIPLIIWMRRRQLAAQSRLSSEILAETMIRPPENASYEGATAPDYPSVKNNGTIALSKRRLAFITITGKSIEIPVSQIRGVREAKWFKSSARGRATHLVVELAAGEVGFYVTDIPAWISAIKSARSQ